MNFPSVILTLYVTISHITDTAQILDGMDVKNTGFEYQVVIITQDGICGGAIIDEWHILTAAHCFDSGITLDILVLAGIIRLKDNTKISRIVKEIHIHPNFTSGIFDFTGHRPRRLGNDIAVLKLDRAIELGGSIKKINLPTANVHYCQICYLSGWGPTEVNGDEPPAVLQWTTLTIGTPEYCKSLGAPHESDEFCAADPFEASTPSPGDSGSAMRCDDEVTGIVSAGFGNPRIPAIFTNVYKHLDFINKIISN